MLTCLYCLHAASVLRTYVCMTNTRTRQQFGIYIVCVYLYFALFLAETPLDQYPQQASSVSVLAVLKQQREYIPICRQGTCSNTQYVL